VSACRRSAAAGQAGTTWLSQFAFGKMLTPVPFAAGKPELDANQDIDFPV